MTAVVISFNVSPAYEDLEQIVNDLRLNKEQIVEFTSDSRTFEPGVKTQVTINTLEIHDFENVEFALEAASYIASNIGGVHRVQTR